MRATRGIIRHGLAARQDLDMGIEPEDLLLQLGVEPAHDADDDDQHRDAQRDAQHGNQSDHRDEGPFGPQVPQRQQQFERQPRHAPEARRRPRRVNESRRFPILPSTFTFRWSVVRSPSSVPFAAGSLAAWSLVACGNAGVSMYNAESWASCSPVGAVFGYSLLQRPTLAVNPPRTPPATVTRLLAQRILAPLLCPLPGNKTFRRRCAAKVFCWMM